MASEVIVHTTCDRCGAVDDKPVMDTMNEAHAAQEAVPESYAYVPDGWEKWQTAERGKTFCPACIEQVNELLAAPMTHIGWASASGSGLSFTGLASTARRDGYITKVYCFGNAVLRRRPEKAS